MFMPVTEMLGNAFLSESEIPDFETFLGEHAPKPHRRA